MTIEAQQIGSPQGPAGPAAPQRLRKRTPATQLVERPHWWTYVILTVFVVGSAFPLYWSFVIGSRTAGAAQSKIPVLTPGPNFGSNVQRVFDTIPFWSSFWNSLMVSTIVTVSVVFFSTLAGYAFAKLQFRGQNAMFGFIILTLAVPPQLGAVGLYRLMATWGMIGSIESIILPGLVSAFGVFFMRQYLSSVVPTELLEAARVDGAGQFRTFLTVAIPAARPAMAVLALFTFITTWTDFFWPFLALRDPKVQTLPTALNQLLASAGNNPDWSVVLTGSLLSIIPLLILFVIAGRQLVSGIMSGALKS
ncbi:binding-protein-dependent transport systems inner membrane component [Xylanimonas cellulosilytica DSM 15894]|uniref:Binding-protein-dependent transport systems inner membrane component n=1 Tax=Xylanimonas cellulosilytica (strain DSM 15894 / JCM 12276 / CECT 5975 / KCTC 9989 / LMG 20990 / NBRC 107835 / XIL07) TaxID=446471 RepID=D1BX59_XYLCX|nr:carbohydrate ABC transporter permease [Xylanimonas cellulosilytica]ACZ31627.1 binding-protein-dependent transport systems inner membrane component [Xylanimonas cellulosilytica DSM 15894]